LKEELQRPKAGSTCVTHQLAGAFGSSRTSTQQAGSSGCQASTLKIAARVPCVREPVSASFFTRGATVRGLVTKGPDGRLGTPDDVLMATGETLGAVQDRVLGNASSSPLFPYVPGFFVIRVRGGFRIGEAHNVLVDLENLNDRNYRGISWGIDGPGRSIGIRYSYRF